MEKNSKTISMGKPEKLSYEQLENFARQASARNTELGMKLNQAEMVINSFKRLDYLLRVIAQRDAYSPEFIKSCVNEVELMMTLPEEDENSKEEEK